MRVAFIGNPNTGKSTLFNALSGLRVRTGNYPGVTVEERIGRVTWEGRAVELIDLPGTYSLTPRSPDELIAVDVLTGTASRPAPDVVVCIASAAALERSLFLVTQVVEIGLPVVVCLNMWDAAVESGQRIDPVRLSQELGVPVVPTSATRRTGLTELRAAILDSDSAAKREPRSFLAADVRDCLQTTISMIRSLPSGQNETDFRIAHAMLEPGGLLERRLVEAGSTPVREALEAGRQRLAALDPDVSGLEARQRYAAVAKLISQVYSPGPPRRSVTDRIDTVLTHRVAGLVVCLAMLMLVFSSIYWFSAPLSDGVEAGLEQISTAVTAVMPPGPFRSLLTDGVIAGVGSVVVFVPQIALLFLFIALLEDCGYMARAAFMLDRLMGLLGLSGRSFLPLMSSFACAVPGIMATRVIEDRKERFVTIMIAPLMSCSARLPVYVLMIWTFLPDRLLAGWLPLRAVVLFAMSMLGLLVAIPVAILLRKCVFHGEPSPLLLELPDYRIPSTRVVLMRVWDSVRSFVFRAGTMIFATSVLVWLAGSYPGDHTTHYRLQAQLESLETQGDAADPSEMELVSQELNQVRSNLLSGSALGQLGRMIEPVVKPLGWNWKIGVGVIASFPAREVIIATLGTIYSLGADVDGENAGLRNTLTMETWPDGTPVFSVPVALSIMVFFALCAQCVSTLMVIRRETNSWKWPVVSFACMTALAWLGAFVTYQVAQWWS
jgi:ferrous iron transport protein B